MDVMCKAALGTLASFALDIGASSIARDEKVRSIKHMFWEEPGLGKKPPTSCHGNHWWVFRNLETSFTLWKPSTGGMTIHWSIDHRRTCFAAIGAHMAMALKWSQSSLLLRSGFCLV